MGDWVYYIVTMGFKDVKQRIKRVDEIHEKAGLKTWLQRELTDTRIEAIKEYLLTQKQRLFNSIVVGIYEGQPEWYPVDVSDQLPGRKVELSERVKSAFGIIELSGQEEMFAIDGQHRVEGIKAACSDSRLKDDELSVILVAHGTSPAGHKRSRRLFSTLNRYAKKVSPAEIVALSEDDTFAIVTRDLVDKYAGLDEERVPLLKQPNISSSDKRTLLSVITLYNIVIALSYPPGVKRPKALITGPPRKADITRLYRVAKEFWTCLKAANKEIRIAMKAEPDTDPMTLQRTATGGNFLFRPHCLGCFAEVVGILKSRGYTMKKAVAKCLKIPMELNQLPWKDVVWDASKNVIIHKNPTLVRNLFLKQIGEELQPKGYQLKAMYKKVVGNPYPTEL